LQGNTFSVNHCNFVVRLPVQIVVMTKIRCSVRWNIARLDIAMHTRR